MMHVPDPAPRTSVSKHADKGPASLPLVLVVDDSPVEQRLAGRIAEQHGFQVVYANDGAEALAMLEQHTPSVVLTDLLMPNMDGLQLVQVIRSRYPLVPIVLMTNYGSEEVAIQALQKGAASYVPKRSLVNDLAATFDQVLTVAKAGRSQQRLLDCLSESEVQFELNNDPLLLPALIAYLQDSLVRLNLCDQASKVRIGIALEEALVNGLYHGNLELDSALRQEDGQAFVQLAEERSRIPPYCNRRVFVRARFTRQQATFVIRDEGPGFDPCSLPDPTDPSNLEKVTGRGMLLIRTFMDEVRHNAAGNEITMIKRRET